MELDTLGLAGIQATQGHPLDASTYALWRMDETTMYNWFSCVDSGSGARTLGPGTFSSSPRPSAGPTTQTISRLVGSRIGAGAQKTTNAGECAATFQGDWTFECYAYFDSLASVPTLYSYGTPGALSTQNNQIGCQVTAAGKLQTTWEAGGGVAKVTTQVAGGTIVVGTWYHLAYVKSGTNVLFYINGALQDTVAYPANADGGSLATHYLGSFLASSGQVNGRMIDVRISNVVRDAATIAADAALITTTCQQPLDASTYILWRLNEAPDCIDAAGHLPLSVVSDAVTSWIAAPLVNPTTGRGKSIYNVGGAFMLDTCGVSTITEDWATALATVLRGSCTLEVWIYPTTTGSTRTLFYFFGTGELIAANFFRVSMTTSGVDFTLTLFWETGAGVDNTYTTGALFSQSDLVAAGGLHLAVVKTVTAGTFVLTTYVNGVLKDTSGAQTNYDGTGATDSQLTVGVAATTLNWIGIMDDMRLSSVARSATEVLSDYTLGAGGKAVARRPSP